jgi:hypothetical protein
VASIENHALVTTLAEGLVVAVKAGSRNEDYAGLVLSHALRIATGLATKNNSAFGIFHNLQQAGATLQCTQDHEHMLYNVQATRDCTELHRALHARHVPSLTADIPGNSPPAFQYCT